MSDPIPPQVPAGDAAFLNSEIVDDDLDDEVAQRAPLTAKRVAIVGVRMVAGVVGLGVAVATIAASVVLPLPTFSSTPPSVLVTPVPTAQQLVCAGSVLRLSDDTGQEATTSSAIGRPVTRSASSSGSVDSNPLEQSDASTGGTAAAPLVISTPPNAADPSEVILLSGAQSQRVDEGDFVGLAAAGCGAVSGDSWLAGGSTAVGRTTLVTLSNPTEVAASVDLELFGHNGAITAPGTSGIVVPASGQRVLSLAGFAPDELAPVVHVTSTGGQVIAELQQSTVRGLQPGGIDIVGPTGAPSLDNVIPGLRVSGIVAVQELQVGGPAFDDLEAVLRLFAPGEGTVSTTISVIPEDGVGSGSSFVFDIDAGRVVDVPIGDLEDGAYTVRVVSDTPTVAAVRVSSAAPEDAATETAAVTDFAWLTASPALSGRAQVTVAPGPDPTLHFANPSASPLTVTVAGTNGETVTVDLPAGASASIPAEESVTYTLSGFDTLFAAVTLSGDGTIARYAVQPAGAGSVPIRVYI